MDGRPMMFAPVFIIVMHGSWFGISDHIERMTQRSSATFPRFGHSSLSSVPHWPYFWNLNGDFIKFPVLRWVRTCGPGMGLPSYFSSIGFGSNVSTWDTPPFMKRKITRFAFGLKCSSLRTPPVPLGTASASEVLSMLDSATMPNPPPIRARAWRRVTGFGWLQAITFFSLLVDEQELVRAEQRPAEGFQGRILGLVLGFVFVSRRGHRRH